MYPYVIIATVFRSFSYLHPKIFQWLCIRSFWLRVYLIIAIPETRRLHYIDIYICIAWPSTYSRCDRMVNCVSSNPVDEEQWYNATTFELSCYGSVGYFSVPNNFELFRFPIYWFRAYFFQKRVVRTKLDIWNNCLSSTITVIPKMVTMVDNSYLSNSFSLCLFVTLSQICNMNNYRKGFYFNGNVCNEVFHHGQFRLITHSIINYI